METSVRWARFRAVAQKIGRGLIYFIASAAFLALGYFAIYFGARYIESRRKFTYEPPPVSVYKNETYHLGLQYPKTWEVKEANTAYAVFSPIVVEGQTKPKEYISFLVSSSAGRAKTACENDSTKCTFRNPQEIVGERTSTPDQEIIFFSDSSGHDFTLSLYKYGEQDFLSIFEAMGKSMRFVTEAQTEQNGAQNN